MQAEDRVIPRMGYREQARVALEILATYPGALRSLRRDDLPTMVRTARCVTAQPSDLSTARERRDTAVRLGRAVTLVMRFIPTDSRCLAQALVLSRMLARRGIDSSLVIGVTPSPEFEAHAWVEHDGRPVNPPGRHSRLAEF